MLVKGRKMEGEKESANALAEERTDLAHDRTDLAVQRTVMAANRTLMAWVRTAISLISFGFTMYKFLQAAAGSAAKLTPLQEQGPRRLGLMLIFLGTASVVLGTVEYVRTVNELDKMGAKAYRPKADFSLIVGALIGLLGLFLFVTILTHTEVF